VRPKAEEKLCIFRSFQKLSESTVSSIWHGSVPRRWASTREGPLAELGPCLRYREVWRWQSQGGKTNSQI